MKESENEKSAEVKQKKPLYRRIINFFIYAFVVLVLLSLLLFGFSQTSTFRNYLKAQITDTFRDNFDGEMKIGKIEGTLLTSLVLRDLSISVEKDTLFKTEKIELRVILTQLLFKNILIRKVEILNGDLNLRELERDKWNI